MAKKRDMVWNNFYAPHANGFKQNPVNDMQALTERMYMRILTELAVNRFKWSGLPKSIDPRFLELELFRNALVVFYFDNDFDRHLALAGAGNGRLNMYGNPTAFNVYGNAQVNKTLSGRDCVPIWSNVMRMPDLDIVMVYANRLATVDRTLEINSMNLRKTKVIIADENTRLSWQNINQQLEEGVPVIYGTSALDSMQAQAFDFGADPQGVLNLQIYKSKLWNECMTLLGINNANQDKKERLVADEVSANDDQVFATRAIALNSRKLAVELINEKYKYKDGSPLEISVDFGSDSDVAPPMPSAGGFGGSLSNNNSGMGGIR